MFGVFRLLLCFTSIYMYTLGNEIMHKLTSDGRTYLLRVELRSYEGDFMYAEYSHFSVGPETDNYRIHVTGYVSNSTAGKKSLNV